MLLHRPEEDLVAGDRDRRLQPRRQPRRLLVLRAAGPAVQENPLRVGGREVEPHAKIAALDGEVYPQRLHDAAADPELQRVVAEECQVRWPAPRGDAGEHRLEQAAGRDRRQPVEVRRACGGQFGFAARLAGQPAEPVHDQEHDLRVVLCDQILVELVHAASLMKNRQRRTSPTLS